MNRHPLPTFNLTLPFYVSIVRTFFKSTSCLPNASSCIRVREPPKMIFTTVRNLGSSKPSLGSFMPRLCNSSAIRSGMLRPLSIGRILPPDTTSNSGVHVSGHNYQGQLPFSNLSLSNCAYVHYSEPLLSLWIHVRQVPVLHLPYCFRFVLYNPSCPSLLLVRTCLPATLVGRGIRLIP